MRGIAVAVLAAAAVAACGTGSAATSDTALTITYWEQGNDRGEPSRWTLRCGPARGTLANPALACRRLEDRGLRVFAPVPRNVACTQIYGGPETAQVTGTLNGRRVSAAFNRRNGCQIARWNRLVPWLLPPGGTA